ncbi:Sec-independent protein translocase protein TatC [Angustibacter aerolatus]|uniref:Sec-independent protein translocase protein TatC n=1 Tax=Angustibacter aerolatus TaxID=1162965 RepID=A0ABQ6JDC4_9ACTN|nr:Sec-independent protein translocase protein TatC [Angustibacter aerolatus]
MTTSESSVPRASRRPGRRSRRDPEARMALREHLREPRNRLVKSALAVVVGAIVGWFLSERFYALLLKPITDSAAANGSRVSINYADPFGAFNQRLAVAGLIGVFLASPVWLWQFWAFITPGLTRKEKRYSVGFVAAALPLFLGGCTLAWFVLPKALEFLNSFVPAGGTNFITANVYFSFVTRIVLAFGIAFVIPVVLVGLNLAHLLSGRNVLKQWRILVFSCFLFSAVATPTPEVTSMLLLAGSMCLLFAVAVGVCLLLDRRRAADSDEPDYDALPDDEASPL